MISRLVFGLCLAFGLTSAFASFAQAGDQEYVVFNRSIVGADGQVVMVSDQSHKSGQFICHIKQITCTLDHNTCPDYPKPCACYDQELEVQLWDGVNTAPQKASAASFYSAFGEQAIDRVKPYCTLEKAELENLKATGVTFILVEMPAQFIAAGHVLPNPPPPYPPVVPTDDSDPDPAPSDSVSTVP